MSLRHNISALGVIALAAGLVGPAAADDAIALATVARQLGFTYNYLPYENAVSLARTGATIVVRPGDSFFTANERREPVYGMVPEYRDNDVFVSPAFVEEIRSLGRPADRADAEALRASSDAAILRPVAAIVPPGSVTSAVASYDAREDRAVVRGIATPGSYVGLRLRAALSESLPVLTLDRTTVVAAADGTFVARLSFGSDRFAPSHYTVEAYGAKDDRPIFARVSERKAVDARTSADDQK